METALQTKRELERVGKKEIDLAAIFPTTGQNPVYYCTQCEDRGEFFVREGTYSFWRDCKNPPCVTRFRQHRYRLNALTSRGEIVSKHLLDSLQLSGKIKQPMWRKALESPHSDLILGDTSIGKTLVLKYWYNTLLWESNSDPAKLLYLTEQQMFGTFRNEQRTEVFFEMLAQQKHEWYFLDELLHENNFRDKVADRDYAIQGHRNYNIFIDLLARSRDWEIKGVVVSSNNSPEIIGDTKNARALIARIYEMSGGRK